MLAESLLSYGLDAWLDNRPADRLFRLNPGTTVESLKVPVKWFLLLLLFMAGFPGWAEVPITNPGLAEHEMLDYTEILGATSHPFSATLNLKGEGAAARYEYRSAGPELESTYWLDPHTLLSLSSETLTRAADATVKRTAAYENLRPDAQPDDLVITDMGSLPMVLRGFPWEKLKLAKIVYIGNVTYGGGGVSFELRVVGQETIVAAGRSWMCWHATTGLAGALSLILPRTDWWFAVEGTHPLVKTSGPAGGPGSPLRTLLLQSYSVK